MSGKGKQQLKTHRLRIGAQGAVYPVCGVRSWGPQQLTQDPGHVTCLRCALLTVTMGEA